MSRTAFAGPTVTAGHDARPESALAETRREPADQRGLAGASDREVADDDHRTGHARGAAQDAWHTESGARPIRPRKRATEARATRVACCARTRPDSAMIQRTCPGRYSVNCIPCRCAYRPPRASSSRWLPISTMRPRSRTTMRSAPSTVERRWAITSVVRPAHQQAQLLLHAPLGLVVERRRRLVEDQHRRVLEQRARDGNALALAARQVLTPIRERRVESQGLLCDELHHVGGTRRRSTSAAVFSVALKAMLLRMVSLNSTTSWLTRLTCARRSVSRYSRTSTPSSRTVPCCTS